MPRQTTQCAVLASELLHAQVGYELPLTYVSGFAESLPCF